MKYKHIVFDIDGTLIDTEYAVLLYVILCYEIFYPLIFPILRFMKANGRM